MHFDVLDHQVDTLSVILSPELLHEARKLIILRDLRFMPITFSKRETFDKKGPRKALPPFKKIDVGLVG